MKGSEAQGPPYFLSSEEYETVKALVETVVPAGEGSSPEPGAREVGAHNYFDSRMLDLPEGARQGFRSTIHLVDDRARTNFGRRFAALASDERAELLRSLLTDPTTMADAFSLRAICLEGFYSDYHDPDYTGKTAWDLVEFKGRRIDGIKKDWSFLRIYGAGDDSQ